MQPPLSADQRQSARYPAPEGALLRVSSSTHQATAFLVDIGLEGAAFEYILLDERPKQGDHIDILADPEEMSIDAVPFRIVFDFEVEPEEPEPVIWRRCGIQFTGLSADQTRRLETLLRHWGLDLPVPTAATGPAAQTQKPTPLDEAIFLARLKLLSIAAKAYLKGYPCGAYRQRAIVRNALDILNQAPLQKVFDAEEACAPPLKAHVLALARAFVQMPPASSDLASLDYSADVVGRHLRGGKALTQMAFLKVA